jgi:hypothetical protein
MEIGTRRVASVPFWGASAVLVFALLVAGLWSSTAVAQDATPGATPAASPAAGTDCGSVLGLGDASVACINVVHAAPDPAPDPATPEAAPALGSVDVLVDGTAALSNLEYGLQSGFIPLPAGTYDLQVTATADPTTVALDLPDTELEAGVAYEIAAIGSLAAGTLTESIAPVDLSELPAETARVRVVHAVTDGPAVDVALAGGEVLIPGLEPGAVSDYVEVPAGGPVDLEIRAAGDADPILPIPGVELVPGTATTIYAAGSVDAIDEIQIIQVQARTAGAPGGASAPAASPAASPSA